MNYICQLHRQALELFTQGIHLVSTDEMTGIQALERTVAPRPMKPKRVERIEFEYIRHGTRSLIANWHIAKGQIISHSLGATRTEEDFKNHIERTVDTDPEAGWIFIVDQLNIHQSESLVHLITHRCDLDIDLGVKRKEGILKSMATRAAFLSDPSHRIRFVYIPKHTSWLNQIECWFSILMRRLLKRTSFTSAQDLSDSEALLRSADRILAFIDYFNCTMAKAFLWKFKGYSEVA